LKRIDLSTGSIQSLAATPPFSLGGTWSPQNIIVFSARFALHQIPATGGPATVVAELDRTRQEDSLRFPQFLPDGRRLLYVARGGRPGQNSAYAGSLDGPPTRLFASVSQVVYSPPAYLLYVRDGTLIAQPFDADTLTLGSDVFPIAEGIGTDPVGMRAYFAVSDNGVLTYRRDTPPKTALRWFDRSGKPLETLGAPDLYSYFRISPDGQRVAADLTDPRSGSRSIWILEPGRSTPLRLTFAGTHDWQPSWTPDGNRIVFASYRDGPLNLYAKPTAGSGPDEPLVLSEEQKGQGDYSPDGRFLAYVTVSETSLLRDVWVLPLAGGGEPIPVARTDASEHAPRFSPDGLWIAYVSDEDGADEVYVQPVPPTGAKWQVSIGGGTEPTWRGDGRELFYLSADGTITAVQVRLGATFEVGARSRLFQAGIGGIIAQQRYDGSRDGQRFLVRTPVEGPPPQPMIVVLNWMAALKK